MHTKIINLFAGPGAGKSTSAAGLFALMKTRGYSVELVTEFAKQMVWQGRTKLLKNNQCYVHAKQLHYLDAVVGQVDFIITDSPTLLSAIYAPEGYSEHFAPFVHEMFRKYWNENFFINRAKPYVSVGRCQTEQEAHAIDLRLQEFLKKHEYRYLEIIGDESAPAAMLEAINTF